MIKARTLHGIIVNDLQWRIYNYKDRYNWNGAMNIVEKYRWRLPTANELKAFYDTGLHKLLILKPKHYWSSTTYAPYTAGAWLVNFYNGFVYNNFKTSTGYVLCVKDAI